LEAAPSVGASFTQELLREVPAACARLRDQVACARPRDQGPRNARFYLAALLEQAFFAVGQWNAREHIGPLLKHFHLLLGSSVWKPDLATLQQVARPCFLSLRKVGEYQRLDQTLTATAEALLGERGLEAALEPLPRKKRDDDCGMSVRVMLNVAEGWYGLDQPSRAGPVIEFGLELLRKNTLPWREQTELACTFAAAVAHAPREAARRSLEAVFSEVRGVRDTYTTRSHFSVSCLRLVETTVLSVVDAVQAVAAPFITYQRPEHLH
jgi:hypothetical protein